MVKDWSPNIGNKTRTFLSILLLNTVPEVPGKVIRQEKEIKGIQINLGRSKTISIHRWHDLVHREKNRESTKNFVELMNKLSKSAGYEINYKN